jgi:serine/threonine protein kinase
MDDKKRIGTYEIIEEIGRGGMSIVYKANHPTLSKLVAIKVLSQYLSNDVTFIERFKNEAQILSSFRHQNIVYMIDFAQEKDTSYLVMDYIDGYTVKQMLGQTGPFSLKIATNIIKGVANALSYTHRKGIIHRDIKSSNIMIDGNGRVLVTDFGLCKENNFTDIKEVPNEFAGTLSYIAPEQLDSKIGKVDERTDIYSLGVVFYEMVTGKMPFNEEGAPVNLAWQHLSVVPEIPSRIKTDLLPKADSIIMKMLEKDPGKRYQSADELLRDMNEMDDILQYYRGSDENREGSYFEVVSNGSQPAEPSLPSQDHQEQKTLDEENDIFIGRVINHHYRVEKLVLKRILSSLYLGRDVIEDIPVTIQIPNETRPTFKARIEREIQTMKNVNYAGFVKFLDVVEEQGTCYVIREYVPGTTVKNYLRKQKLSITQSIEIILEVLDSLQYLHEHGIIHRDLNSDVVIIANKGPAKITSLGFTRVEDASSVSSGEFLGVVQYTAPEQITQSKSDSKSDIYSVGILLFEMLTGSPPFDSPLPVEVMDMHLKKMPRFPEESQKEIPLNLQRIVLKALSKSPDQRFSTAKEMGLELRNFASAYEKGDDRSFDISTSTGEDASSIIYKNLPDSASVKTDSLAFSLKKKQDTPKEKEMQKKVDVNKMMNDGLRGIGNSKQQKQKAESTFSTNFNAEIKEKPEKKKEKEEPSKFTPESVLPEQKLPGGGFKIIYYLMGIIAMVALVLFIFNTNKVSQPVSTVSTLGIEIVSPNAPYEMDSFTLYPMKVKYPSGKDIQRLVVSSVANEIQATVLSMKEGSAQIQFYVSIARINFKFPFDIVALDSKGKEVGRKTFQGLLKNQKMVEVIIKPTEGIIEKRDAKEISPTTTKLLPLLYQFNLYVPIAEIIPMFNGALAYDLPQQKITITNMDAHTYELFLFKAKYLVDGILYEGENPINEILNYRNDRAYLPIYFLTEKMGFIMRIEQGSTGNLEIHMIRAK